MFFNKKIICLSVIFVVGLLLTSCWNKKNYSFNGVELGMSVDELIGTGKVTKSMSLASLMNPGYQPFRFNDSQYNSVVVQDGIVTQINAYDFSENQSVEKKKDELIKTYGEPTFVSGDKGEFIMGWGDVKKTEKGWSAKGNFITANVSPSGTNISIIKGDPTGWNNYSSAIVM